MKYMGWRKPTPGFCKAQAYAKLGEQMNIAKSQAIIALKRVASAIGLNGNDMLLIDQLSAFSAATDWSEGQRPLVWPSNQFLSECTGMSIGAIKRHLRKLGDAGLITFSDSANGHRWGKRDSSGHITQAYGIDLSPLKARVHEFEAMYEEIQHERRLRKALKQEIIIARRSIRMIIETARDNDVSGEWDQFQQEFEILLANLPNAKTPLKQIQLISEDFIHLQNDIRQSYDEGLEIIATSALKPQEPAIESTKMNPKGLANEPHIPITNQYQLVIQHELKSDLTCKRSNNENNKEQVQAPISLTPAMIIETCPQFEEIASALGSKSHDWQYLHHSAEKIRPMIGIKNYQWLETCQFLGIQKATVALCLIYEKYSEGTILSPSAYLKSLIEREQQGILHLEKSIYGRLKEMKAERPSCKNLQG